MANMVKEFKTFISRGSVLDLAVGVVIGAAFGKIVASLINDIIMPPIGVLLGNVNFTELKLTLGGIAGQPPVTINYGNFIQVVIEFLLIALAIFMVVKAFNSMKKKEEEIPAPPPPPTPTESLLGEIRDLLKK